MPAWIDPASPLRPWRDAERQPLPEPGVAAALGTSWRPAGADWFAVNGGTGGWALFSDAERRRLEGGLGQSADPSRDALLAIAWRRGLVTVGGRGCLDRADWDCAVEETREHYGLIVILNSGCNLACTYCYLGHGAPGDAHAVDTTLAYAAIRAAMGRPEPSILIDFGEFSAAAKVFHDAVRYAQEQAAAAGKRLRIAVQTNATTLSDEAVRFLAERDAVVGVSLDGPERIHDRARVLRSGRGTYAHVAAALARCRQAGLDYHLIVTIGAHNVAQPGPVLDEIERQAPKTFLCKPILAHGEARTGWDAVGAGSQQIAGFLRAAVGRATVSGLGMLDQSAAKFLCRLLGDSSGWREGCTSRRCSSGRNLHVLSARGELHACPRFVDPGSGLTVDRRTVGLQITSRAGLLAQSLHAAPASCAGCPWLASCGGGCTLSGQPGLTGTAPLPDEHCPSYVAQHEEITGRLLPALLAGTVPLTGPLAGARIRAQAAADWPAG